MFVSCSCVIPRCFLNSLILFPMFIYYASKYEVIKRRLLDFIIERLFYTCNNCLNEIFKPMVEIKQGTAYAVPCFGVRYQLGRLPQTLTQETFQEKFLGTSKAFVKMKWCIRCESSLAYLSFKKGKCFFKKIDI